MEKGMASDRLDGEPAAVAAGTTAEVTSASTAGSGAMEGSPYGQPDEMPIRGGQADTPPSSEPRGQLPAEAGPPDAVPQDAPSASTAGSGATESSPYGQPEAVPEDEPTGVDKYLHPPPFQPSEEKPRAGSPFASGDDIDEVIV